MSRDGSTPHVQLLREAMAGTADRRRLLRRGLRLGLSAPALAALLVGTGFGTAKARRYEEITLDPTCVKDCNSAKTWCEMAGKTTCAAEYNACLGTCI